MTAATVRQIGAGVHRRLRAAQTRGLIPRQGSATDRGPAYRVMITRVIRTGETILRIEISGFGYLVPPPRDDLAVIAWMLTSGRELVAEVDRIASRDSYDPPLAGRTTLIAEFCP